MPAVATAGLQLKLPIDYVGVVQTQKGTMLDEKQLQIAVHEGRDIKKLLKEWFVSIDIESPRFWEHMCDFNEWLAEVYQFLYEMEKTKRIALEEKYGISSKTE